MHSPRGTLFLHSCKSLCVQCSPRVWSTRHEKGRKNTSFCSFQPSVEAEQNCGGVWPAAQRGYKQDHLQVTPQCSLSCHWECISAACSLTATIYFCLLSCWCCSFYTNTPWWFMPISGLKKRLGLGLEGQQNYKGTVMAMARSASSTWLLLLLLLHAAQRGATRKTRPWEAKEDFIGHWHPPNY